VTLKRAYNDDRRTRLQDTAILNGSQWYQLQAFRALNQAFGRCIRHINDWAAIMLLDVRLSESNNTQRLSRWVRDAVKPWRDYQKVFVELSEFYAAQPMRMEQRKAKQASEEERRMKMLQPKQHQQPATPPAPVQVQQSSFSSQQTLPAGFDVSVFLGQLKGKSSSVSANSVSCTQCQSTIAHPTIDGNATILLQCSRCGRNDLYSIEMQLPPLEPDDPSIYSLIGDFS
jgi:hypothetical protein